MVASGQVYPSGGVPSVYLAGGLKATLSMEQGAQVPLPFLVPRGHHLPLKNKLSDLGQSLASPDLRGWRGPEGLKCGGWVCSGAFPTWEQSLVTGVWCLAGKEHGQRGGGHFLSGQPPCPESKTYMRGDLFLPWLGGTLWVGLVRQEPASFRLFPLFPAMLVCVSVCVV